LERQIADYREGRATIYLNVLQAITNWGDAVSSESQALTQYNVEIANLSRQTGVILETHGIRFFEEQYGSIGPLGRLAHLQSYPRAERPSSNVGRYESTDEPAENAFNLEDPLVVPGDQESRTPDEPPPPEPPEEILAPESFPRGPQTSDPDGAGQSTLRFRTTGD
jgi:hypothetical protein